MNIMPKLCLEVSDHSHANFADVHRTLYSLRGSVTRYITNSCRIIAS